MDVGHTVISVSGRAAKVLHLNMSFNLVFLKILVFLRRVMKSQKKVREMIFSVCLRLIQEELSWSRETFSPFLDILLFQEKNRTTCSGY